MQIHITGLISVFYCTLLTPYVQWHREERRTPHSSSDLVSMAVLMFFILHPIKKGVTIVSLQCETVYYNKLQGSLIYFDLLLLSCLTTVFWILTNEINMQNPSRPSNTTNPSVYYQACHRLTANTLMQLHIFIVW